jgi:hypothetical protein
MFNFYKGVSVDFWVNQQSKAKPGCIFYCYGNGVSVSVVYTNTNALAFQVYGNTIETDSQPNDSIWRKWTCVFEPKTYTLSIYLNGVKNVSKKFNLIGSQLSSSIFYIGLGLPSTYFTGLIVGFRLWPSVLFEVVPEKITENAMACASDNLLAQYDFVDKQYGWNMSAVNQNAVHTKLCVLYKWIDISDAPFARQYPNEVLSKNPINMGYVTCEMPMMTPNTFTIEFWWRMDEMDENRIVTGTQMGTFAIFFENTDQCILTFQNYSPGWGKLSSDPVALDDDWHHWSVTYDQSITTACIYRDGVLAGTNSKLNYSYHSGPVTLNINDFRLPYEGEMAYFKLWKKTLTLDEVATSMQENATAVDPDLVLRFPFHNKLEGNIGQNSLLSNTSDFGANYTVPKSGPFSVQAFNKALYLKGNDYAKTSNVIVNTTSNLIIDFYAKQEAFDILQTVFLANNISIQFTAANNFIFIINNTAFQTTNAFIDSAWHHWAVALDEPNNTVSIYRDAVLIQQWLYKASWNLNSDVYFGCDRSLQLHFTGALCNFRIWENAFHYSELSHFKDKTSNGSEVGLIHYWPMSCLQNNVLPDIVGKADATLHNQAALDHMVNEGNRFTGEKHKILLQFKQQAEKLKLQALQKKALTIAAAHTAAKAVIAASQSKAQALYKQTLKDFYFVENSSSGNKLLKINSNADEVLNYNLSNVQGVKDVDIDFVNKKISWVQPFAPYSSRDFFAKLYMVSSNPTNLPLANTDFSICCWIRLENNKVDQLAISIGKDGSQNALQIGFKQNGAVCFDFGPNKLISSPGAVDNNWHYWCFTYNNATKTRTIYQDNHQIANIAGTAFCGDTSFIKISGTLSNELYLTGSMTRLRIYNEQFSTSDMNTDKFTHNAYWNHKLLSGWSLSSLSSGGYDYTGKNPLNSGYGQGAYTSMYTNPPAWTNDAARAPYGNVYAIKFNGSGTLIQPTCKTSVANKSFTVEFWACYLGNNNLGSYAFYQGQNGDKTELSIGYNTADQLIFSFGNNQLVADAKYTDHDWHHWTFEYDINTMQQTIYQDGIQIAQRRADANYTASGQILIGNNTGYGNTGFSGYLSQIRMWEGIVPRNVMKTFMTNNDMWAESNLPFKRIGYWPCTEGNGDSVFNPDEGQRIQFNLSSNISWQPINVYAGIKYLTCDLNGNNVTKKLLPSAVTSSVDSATSVGNSIVLNDIANNKKYGGFPNGKLMQFNEQEGINAYSNIDYGAATDKILVSNGQFFVLSYSSFKYYPGMYNSPVITDLTALKLNTSQALDMLIDRATYSVYFCNGNAIYICPFNGPASLFYQGTATIYQIAIEEKLNQIFFTLANQQVQSIDLTTKTILDILTLPVNPSQYSQMILFDSEVQMTQSMLTKLQQKNQIQLQWKDAIINGHNAAAAKWDPVKTQLDTAHSKAQSTIEAAQVVAHAKKLAAQQRKADQEAIANATVKSEKVKAKAAKQLANMAKDTKVNAAHAYSKSTVDAANARLQRAKDKH